MNNFRANEKKADSMNIKDAKLSGGCHVVILGAGASIAATIRDPEEHGLKLSLIHI